MDATDEASNWTDVDQPYEPTAVPDHGKYRLTQYPDLRLIKIQSVDKRYRLSRSE